LSDLKEFASGFLPSNDAIVFVDNYDSQRDLPIGEILTFARSRLYKIANAFMMAWPYGYAQIMSSYKFNTMWQGPPSNEGIQLLVDLFKLN
jgi:alpha-amylase